MIGFNKYNRLLNKKRKQEAYLDLVEGKGTKEDTEIKTHNGNETHSPNGKELKGDSTAPPNSRNMNVVLKECSEMRKKFKLKQKQLLGGPKLYLEPRGEKSRLSFKNGKRHSLTFDCLQRLILGFQSHVDKPKTCPSTWFKLVRRRFLSRVLIVVVEGLGLDELTAITQGRKDKHSPPSPENTGNNLNGSVAMPTSPPPRKKKRKDVDPSDSSSPAEDQDPPTKRQKVQELNDLSEMVAEALPHSSSLFKLHVEVEAPSKYSCDPIQELFSLDTENQLKMNKSADSAPKSQSSAPIEDPSPATVAQPDKVNRLKLLLSAEELVRYNFPLRVEGNVAFNNPQYQMLHENLDKVTKTSPMFGIDCEMCLTFANENELTRVAVVDEQLNVIYSSLVKPANVIANYMTKYSGVTREMLTNVATTLEDVQNHLRKILPKDAILVGHSLDSDFKALKLIHPYVIDTSLVYNVSTQRFIRPSLKVLAQLFLRKAIQTNLRSGHDPSEDALTSLQLALLKLQQSKSFGDAVQGGDVPFRMSEQRRVELEMKLLKWNDNLHRGSLKEIRTVFLVAQWARWSSSIVSPKEDLVRFRGFYESPNDCLSCVSAEGKDEALRVASERVQDKQIVVAHWSFSDCFADDSWKGKKSRRELKQLDKGLKNLLNNVPEHTLVMTIFTGSPNSVPVEKRSNGIALIDLKGQEKIICGTSGIL